MFELVNVCDGVWVYFRIVVSDINIMCDFCFFVGYIFCIFIYNILCISLFYFLVLIFLLKLVLKIDLRGSYYYVFLRLFF